MFLFRPVAGARSALAATLTLLGVTFLALPVRADGVAAGWPGLYFAALVGSAQDTDVEFTTLGVLSEVTSFKDLPLVGRLMLA